MVCPIGQSVSRNKIMYNVYGEQELISGNLMVV